MNNFQVALLSPCSKCEENDIYYSNLLKKLWEKLRSFICDEKPVSICQCNELPVTLFKSHKLLFQLVFPNTLINGKSNDRKNEESGFLHCKENWINLSEETNLDLDLKTLLSNVEEFISGNRDVKSHESYSDEHWSENIAEQLHKIMDQLPNSGYIVNIYWLVCGQAECVNTSNHIPLYGALKRLQTWNNAHITWFLDSEEEMCNNHFYESWNEELDITLTNSQHLTEPLADTNIVWYGSLTPLEDQPNTKNMVNNSDWCLSRGQNSDSLQLSVSNLNSISEGEDIIKISENVQELLKDKMTVICELNQCDIPLWKIFPYRFILYHTTSLSRVFEIEKLSNACDELNFEKTVLLASLESCQKIIFTKKTTTENWIEFVKTGLNNLGTGNIQDSAKTIELFYLLLYPLEPGVFHVYFLRPEKSLCNFHSMLSVYGASVSREKPAVEIVNKLRKAVDNLPLLSTELFENWMKKFNEASFLSFTKQLSNFKGDSQSEGKQHLTPTELWEIFLTSYTETAKTHSLSNGLSSNGEENFPSDCSPPTIPDHVPCLDEDVWPERQWLKMLDSIYGLDASPFKSQFSLAVHLDANEMLKHFTKDGKPMKKELESMRREIEKRKNSPVKQEDKRREFENGIDYCTDNSVPSSSRTFSPKLFPKHVKHETLSICNTPKTLAMAKLQGVKRKAKSESAKGSDTGETQDPQPSTSKPKEHLNTKDNKAKSGSSKRPKVLAKKTSTGESKKQTTNENNVEGKQHSSTTGTTLKKKKRRSYDGSETAPLPAGSNPNAKEKRSDRHKRRLARVVKRSLVNYGVDPNEVYFDTCSERLYYLCKSFLKDLTTSDGLNNEMKRLAESNVGNVVEFEKRRQVPKQTENKL